MPDRVAGQDGISPWYRVRCRNVGLRQAGFAEQWVYKLSMKGPDKIARGNVSANPHRATYIGCGMASCEHRCIGDTKVVSSRHPMRLPELEEWLSDILEHITILIGKRLGMMRRSGLRLVKMYLRRGGMKVN